jgi:hypothetical protein
MKHQYFGDINDFCKYGLLQILCGEGKLRLGVCWMLTPDDTKNDGSQTGYLEAPERWRAYNPRLFDFLLACVYKPGARNVSSVELPSLLPGAQFCSEVLTDSSTQRQSYFSEMLKRFSGADLIFFDPDNGFEIDSVPFGKRNSSKYLYWSEVSKAFAAKHSILVYQHFPREERNKFAASLAAKLRGSTGGAEVYSFRTRHVIFVLVPRREHIVHFRHVAARVAVEWANQFEVSRYGSRR